jgi:hypothetical protein
VHGIWLVSLTLLQRVALRFLLLYLSLFLTLVFPHIDIPCNIKQAIILFFIKGNKASVSNYRPTAILNAFSKVFEFILHGHISHYFKSKLNSFQHGFTKSESTTTDFITCLDTVIPTVCYQGQWCLSISI